jgi:hypothetical protein
MKNASKQISIIAIVIITLAIIGCKEDEPDPVLCNCPNGTLHLVGETCCEGTNCTCEKNVVGQRVQGIPVTSRGGDHTKTISNVTTAFGNLTPEGLTIIKNNVREIKVTSGTGRPTFSKLNGKYIIEIRETSSSNDIFDYAVDGVVDEVSNGV